MLSAGWKRILAMQMLWLLAGLSAAQASSYFVDRIDEPAVLLEAASLGFSDGGSVQADLHEADEHIEPFQSGEAFTVRFTAQYEGNVDAAVIPRLKLKISGAEAGDVILVSDGTNTVRAGETEGILYSPLKTVSSGDTVAEEYTITIEKSNEKSINFAYDYSICAIQQQANADQLAFIDRDSQPELAALDQKARNHENIAGFIVVTDPELAADSGGSRAIKKTWAVSLRPEVIDGNSESVCQWYIKYPDKEEIQLENSNSFELNLNLSDIHNGIQLRFEVKNLAGTVQSERFVLQISDEEIAVERGNE